MDIYKFTWKRLLSKTMFMPKTTMSFILFKLPYWVKVYRTDIL